MEWASAIVAMRIQDARGVLKRATAHVYWDSDTITYQAAVSAAHQTRLDTITYSAAVSALEEGIWDHAVLGLVIVSSARVELDTITYHAAVIACEKYCQWRFSWGPSRRR